MSESTGLSLTIALIGLLVLIIALGPAAIAGTIIFLFLLSVVLGILS